MTSIIFSPHFTIYIQDIKKKHMASRYYKKRYIYMKYIKYGFIF